MKFDLDAYEKVFPRKEESPAVETAVEGFNPTAEEAAKNEKAKDEEPGEDEAPEAVTTESEEDPPEGEENG